VSVVVGESEGIRQSSLHLFSAPRCRGVFVHCESACEVCVRESGCVCEREIKRASFMKLFPVPRFKSVYVCCVCV